MKIETADINTIKPYENNPRKLKDSAIEKVAMSLKEYGFRQPIVVDKDRIIVVGHTRYRASKKLGLKEVPITIADNLTPEQINAYRIADNRTAEESEWDSELLKMEIKELEAKDFKLDLLGFNEDQLNDMLFEEKQGLTDEDEVPEAPEEPITKLGNIWKLGNHRVMCGDCTFIDNIDLLTKKEKIDMVFTDPPYNIDYQGVKDKRKIKNDKMDDESFVDFLTSSLLGCETMYVCCSWQYAHLFREAMIKIARKPKAMIIWDKVNPAQHLDKYFKQHEIIYYYGDFGGQKTLRGDVWNLKRKKNTLHPTMKPVELITMALEDQKDKKTVYDGFLGSGSTIIACEKMDRICYGMELDPKYCDVIIKRWENFTGKKAELENGQN
jgi:site-specific DNA-methyltransferase (adenine-specific)